MSRDETSFSQYFGNIFYTIKTCIKGMWITGKYVMNNKPVTIEYPEVREVLPERARMRLYNDVLNCISCNMCALSCPVDCIYIASVKRPKEMDIPKTDDGTPKRQVLTQYVIDTALCCYCGLCTTVCPTECLTHTKDYEFAQYTCSDMKYDYMQEDIIAWRNRIVVK
jgi:NADH-quinone oxidoreductase subunit I